jgi:FkbM family methyltransferase
MPSQTGLRLRKLAFSTLRPRYWRALAKGVAPSVEHLDILAGLDADLVIDVGANRGQFSLIARHAIPGAPIEAFEPLPAEGAVYRAVMAGERGVNLNDCALGEVEGVARLHVSRRADSSSLLPIGALQAKLFPNTEEVGVHEVKVLTLDSLRGRFGKASRMLLKLDVQGFELSVLRGATRTLEQCRHVYAECSEVPLYDGQALFPEVERHLSGLGFRLITKANPQVADGRLIQSDCLFGRA